MVKEEWKEELRRHRARMPDLFSILTCELLFCSGVITDFISFYTLPSTVMHHPTHKTLKAAYAYYNVALNTPLEQLMQVKFRIVFRMFLF